MENNNEDKNILEELPTYSFKWPCKTCGATDASAFNFDKETMEVTDCNKCENTEIH